MIFSTVHSIVHFPDVKNLRSFQTHFVHKDIYQFKIEQILLPFYSLFFSFYRLCAHNNGHTGCLCAHSKSLLQCEQFSHQYRHLFVAENINLSSLNNFTVR